LDSLHPEKSQFLAINKLAKNSLGEKLSKIQLQDGVKQTDNIILCAGGQTKSRFVLIVIPYKLLKVQYIIW
jgi:hypothetical protein